MAEETITIVKIGTDDAVKNITDLRNNIKALKEGWEDANGQFHQGLNDLKIGTPEYKTALDELKINQNALKDAMYATSASMEDLAKAATGTSETYNSLVHRMASLKEELRNTDVSTKAGGKRFAELAEQIDDVNSKLKAMDALQGNFQRNVGNYQTAFKGLGEKVDGFAKGLTALKGGINGAKGAFDAMAKTPLLVVFGLMVNSITSLVAHFKESEEGAEKLEAGMVNLEPILNVVRGIIGKLSDIIGKVVINVSEFLGSNGLIKKIINGIVGVGNAIVQFVISPFKAVVAAIKTFKEQGIKGLGNAAKAFGEEMKSGVSFKENFKAGQAFSDALINGSKSKKKEVKAAGKGLGKEAADGWLEGIEEQLDRESEAEFAAWEKAMDDANKAAAKAAEGRIKSLDKAVDHQLELNSILVENEEEREAKEYAIREEGNKKKLDLISQFMKDAMDRGDLDTYLALDQERADLEVEIETNAIREKERLRKKDMEDAKEKAEAQKQLLQSVASVTSDIFGSLADLYEADEANAEKNAEKVKALRIAQATIDTISGAIAAYMNAVKSITDPIAGQIVGAASAAAVTASGMAQIAQIRSTNVASGSSVPASIPAPSFPTEMPNVRSITSSSEEDRLNQMAQDQRVYILASDIQASQGQIRTQVSESSF